MMDIIIVIGGVVVYQVESAEIDHLVELSHMT